MPHLLLHVWISPLRPCRSMNALQWRRGAAAKREFRIPQNQVVPGLERPLSLTPSKTRPIPSANQHRGQPRPPRDLHCRKKTARPTSSRNRSVIRCPTLNERRHNRRHRRKPSSGYSALRGHPLRAIRRIANAAPAVFATGDAAFFRRAPSVSRCAAPVQPTVAIHGGSDSVLGVTRHRSDLPLVERAGLDQSK